jgi:membrane protein YqaA with SNARE-associated domain
MRIQPKQLIRGMFSLLLVTVLIGINVYVINTPELIDRLQSVGLWGLFGLSILSGFNVVVPIPIAALYPSFAAFGYPATVIISIIALGMTLGDSIGYLLGMGARSFVTDTGKIQQFILRHTDRPLLLAFFILLYGMVIPLPNELIVIPLAALRIPWYVVLLPLLIGNIVFTMLLAFGASGVTQFFL